MLPILETLKMLWAAWRGLPRKLLKKIIY